MYSILNKLRIRFHDVPKLPTVSSHRNDISDFRNCKRLRVRGFTTLLTIYHFDFMGC